MNFVSTFSSFSVKDLGQAYDFYTQVLGLRATINEMGVMELDVQGKGPIIVYPKNDHQPARYTVLSFVVPDLEAEVDGLIAKGIVFEQYAGAMATNEKGISRMGVGPAHAWFKDPAGNILSLMEMKDGA